MPLYIGDKKITKILVGDKEVTKMFFGDDEVSPEPGPGPTPGGMTFTYNLTSKVTDIYELLEDATLEINWKTGPAPEKIQKSSYDFVAYAGSQGSTASTSYNKYNFSESDVSATGCTVSNIRILTSNTSWYGTIRFTLSNFTGSAVVNLDASATPTQVCLLEGTRVLLADGSYKKIEDIEYTDRLVTYDPFAKTFVATYPLTISVGPAGSAHSCVKLTTESGRELNIVGGGHTVYNRKFDIYQFISQKNSQNLNADSLVLARYENGSFVDEVVSTIEHIDLSDSKLRACSVYTPMVGSIITEDLLTGGDLMFGYDLETFLKGNKNSMNYSNELISFIRSLGHVNTDEGFVDEMTEYVDSDYARRLFECSFRRYSKPALDAHFIEKLPDGYGDEDDRAFIERTTRWLKPMPEKGVVLIDGSEYEATIGDTFTIPLDAQHQSYLSLSNYESYKPGESFVVQCSTSLIANA